MPLAHQRRVLFISYAFPPVGGAGVQRTSKFVKYLPQTGWIPSVLTASNPSVPVFDHTLLADIPPETHIVRARTWEPSYAIKRTVAAQGGRIASGQGYRHKAKQSVRRLANLILQPDPQILWGMNAVRLGVRSLKETAHHVIVASGPPFSSFLIGAAISRRTGVPLVLDYRDEWDLSNCCWENKQFGHFSLAIQRRLQHRVIRQARALLATSRPSACALEAIRDQAGGVAKVSCLYNGFDPDEFNYIEPPALNGDGRYRLVYVGTLWNLTTTAPLVEAVQQLCAERPDLAPRLELIFAGRRTPHEECVLSKLEGLPCKVTLLPYLEHAAAIDLMSSASALCALLADTEGAERVVPAKIFEYLATGRPILVIAPRGELWHIADESPATFCMLPSDVRSICRRLAAEIERGDLPLTNGGKGKYDPSKHSRKQQAIELGKILDEVVVPNLEVA